MLQKFKVALYAIMISIWTLFVSTSSAIAGGHVVTHTPGETVGPGAVPAIKYEWFADPNKVFDGVDEPHRTRCEMLLAGYTLTRNYGICYTHERAIMKYQGYLSDCDKGIRTVQECNKLRKRFGVDVPTCEVRELNKTHLTASAEALVTEGNPNIQAHYKNSTGGLWRGGLGLGTSIRYTQYTGGCC